MKFRVLKLLFVSGIVIMSVSCLFGQVKSDKTSGNHCSSISENVLLLEDGSQRIDAIFYLHKCGKSAIPILIDNISNDKEIFMRLFNPVNSDLRGDTGKMYVGELSAYLVELILGRDALIKKSKSKIDQGFSLGANSQNYVYGKGIIVNEKKTRIIKEDLLNIHSFYRKWWQENGGKDITDLRKQWKSGDKILPGSGYYWE